MWKKITGNVIHPGSSVSPQTQQVRIFRVRTYAGTFYKISKDDYDM